MSGERPLTSAARTRGRRANEWRLCSTRPCTAGSTPSQTTKHLAYGEAAVMLIECLMVLLIEQRVFSVHQMVAAVETAIATKRQMVRDGTQAELQPPPRGS
jgi:hypothetical protein